MGTSTVEVAGPDKREGKPVLGDESKIDSAIAIASAAATVGQAAEEVDPEQTIAEALFPQARRLPHQIHDKGGARLVRRCAEGARSGGHRCTPEPATTGWQAKASARRVGTGRC